MSSWKSPPTTGCPEQASSPLWVTRVHTPLSEFCSPRSRTAAAVSRQRVLGFWPEATHFRRKVWPRAETVAVTFIHLQTENTPCFPNSLYHGKITLEALKWIKSNFLPLPIDWYWYPRCNKFPAVLFWGLEINLSPPPSNSPSFPSINSNITFNLNLHHLFFLPLAMGFQVTCFGKFLRTLYLKFLLVSQVCFRLA